MPTDNELIALYRIAKRRLAWAKANETALRLVVASHFFPFPNLGVNYSSDKLLKLTAKNNVSISKDAETVSGLLAEISEQCSGLQLGDLVKWEPKLNFAEYEKLPVEAKRIFAHCMTIKPAMPVIAFTDEKETEE